MVTALQMKASELQESKDTNDRERPAASPVTGSDHKTSGVADSKVLRFAKSERFLHWAIAGPFLICFATGVTLALIYNPDPSRPFRGVFSMLHRVSAIALITLPMLATYKGRGEVAIHFHNIKQAWVWMWDDFKWLALMGLAAVNPKIQLPEQGKFNAAEKLNFMMLMTTYPLYVLTGLLMWFTHLAVLSWIMHILMALLSAPLLLGHLYMALINNSTRPGLDGMISGHVDRHWAKHHYGRWYREHHSNTEKQRLEEARENKSQSNALEMPDGMQELPPVAESFSVPMADVPHDWRQAASASGEGSA